MSWPVQQAFKNAVERSHTPTLRFEILENGVVVASSAVLTSTSKLTITEGRVDHDRKATVGRRALDATIIDHKNLLAPIHSNSAVHPLRDRDLRVWRGIEGVSASADPSAPVDVPLATVQLLKSRLTYDEAGATWTVSGSDRSTLLSEAQWRDELVIAAGTTPYAATQAVLAAIDPGHTYVIVASPTTKVLDELVFVPGDSTTPWDAIRKFWEAAGMDVGLDQLGQIRAQPFLNPLTAPIARSFLDDDRSIRVAPLTADIDRSTLRNGVVVQGTAPWLLYGVYGEAWDTDPSSPTYYDPLNPSLSLVGPHPEYVDDPLVSNSAEATALAVAKLPDVLGIEEAYSFSMLPDPSLEGGDVIEMQNTYVQPKSRLVLDRVTTPFGWGVLQDSTARRRTR